MAAVCVYYRHPFRTKYIGHRRTVFIQQRIVFGIPYVYYYCYCCWYPLVQSIAEQYYCYYYYVIIRCMSHLLLTALSGFSERKIQQIEGITQKVSFWFTGFFFCIENVHRGIRKQAHMEEEKRNRIYSDKMSVIVGVASVCQIAVGCVCCMQVSVSAAVCVHTANVETSGKFPMQWTV